MKRQGLASSQACGDASGGLAEESQGKMPRARNNSKDAVLGEDVVAGGRVGDCRRIHDQRRRDRPSGRSFRG
jgi:hypothetical protein